MMLIMRSAGARTWAGFRCFCVFVVLPWPVIPARCDVGLWGYDMDVPTMLLEQPCSSGGMVAVAGKCASVRVVAGRGCCRGVVIWVIGLRAWRLGCMVGAGCP